MNDVEKVRAEFTKQQQKKGMKVIMFGKHGAVKELKEREREILQKEKLKKLQAERLRREKEAKREYDRQYAKFKEEHPS